MRHFRKIIFGLLLFACFVLPSACSDPVEELKVAGCDPELPGFPCCLPNAPKHCGGRSLDKQKIQGGGVNIPDGTPSVEAASTVRR